MPEVEEVCGNRNVWSATERELKKGTEYNGEEADETEMKTNITGLADGGEQVEGGGVIIADELM